MFIGHFGAALIAKRISPDTSLGTLFAAAQWIDLLWPALLLAGVETAEVDHSPGAVIPLKFSHYPFSHSLAAVLAWAVLLGLLAWWRTGAGRAALVVAALAASHWLLDLIVHIPDLPLSLDGGTRLGLGLWQWPLAALGLEAAIFGLGIALYLSARRSQGEPGNWKLYSLFGFLAVIQVMSTFGPPPPSITPVAWSGMAIWLLVAWGWWADRPGRTSSPD